MNNECMLTPWVDIRYLIGLIEVSIIITSERLLTGDWNNGSSEVLEIFYIFPWVVLSRMYTYVKIHHDIYT